MIVGVSNSLVAVWIVAMTRAIYTVVNAERLAITFTKFYYL